MAKHRAVSNQSVRARTVVGGVLAGGAVMLAAPVGIASATTSTHAAVEAAALQKKPVNTFQREIRVVIRQILKSLEPNRGGGGMQKAF
jgi:hypothetical protein